MSQGILRGEKLAKNTEFDDIDEVYTNADAFAQTPKYIQDSSNTDRMARFFVADSLLKALESYYGTTASKNYLLNALNTQGYFDFFLTSVSDSSQDRYQLQETMGDNYALYGFNKAPEILTCSGILKNTQEDDWRVQFLEFFKRIGGISSLAKFYNYNIGENKKVANYITFKYDSVFKRGALLNVSHSLQASNEMDIPFSFSFIVTRTINFTQITQKSSESSSSIALNQGNESSIIDGNIGSVRTITQSGLRTLEPKDTPNNPSLNKTLANKTKNNITSTVS
jgi:hypothetical protein